MSKPRKTVRNHKQTAARLTAWEWVAEKIFRALLEAYRGHPLSAKVSPRKAPSTKT